MKIRMGKIVYYAIFAAILVGCRDNTGEDIPYPTGSGGSGNTGGGSTGSGTEDIWLIPINEVLIGAARDAIPALENPEALPVSETNYLENSDLVIGYVSEDGKAMAFPHKILDWHEIINFELNTESKAITYCPLTGTGIGWSRTLGGQVTTFGVSGFLYNTNLIPYDRETASNWSQMRLDCVNGQLIGDKIETFQVLETSWATWKAMFPDSEVVSTNTGWPRPYDSYPYINQTNGDYRIDPYLLFPVIPNDDRLPRKARVLGVIVNGQAKAYRFSSFDSGSDPTVLMDDFIGDSVVIVGSKRENYLMAFNRILEDGTELSFESITGSVNPTEVMTDNEGNIWNIFGKAVSGPRQGEKLGSTVSYIGYFFAWGAFYPGIEIYDF